MGKFNDIDLDGWRESDINTDSLWLIGERAKSGKHKNVYHGNFIPQIPYRRVAVSKLPLSRRKPLNSHLTSTQGWSSIATFETYSVFLKAGSINVKHAVFQRRSVVRANRDEREFFHLN